MTLKIGCFGSVLTFSPDREVCKTCELRDACALRVFEREPAVERLLVLRETERGTRRLEEVDGKAVHDVRKYFARRRKQYLSVHSPRKSRAERDYEALLNRGVDFSLLKAGKNPIGDSITKFEFVRQGIDLILKERIITPKDIQDHLMSTGECKTTTTARVYANRIISILTQSGNVKKEGKVYCLQA